MQLRPINILVLLLALSFSACEDPEVDTMTPETEFTSFTPNPGVAEICGGEESNVFSVSGGDVLSFNATFKDNIALSQFKVDIHNNFDCHGHGGNSAPAISPPNVSGQTTDWSVLDIQDLSGTEVQQEYSLTVPENVTAGVYHYQIRVLDEAGNDNGGNNFFSLKITNAEDIIAPEITVNEPATTSFTAAKGEVLRFSGQVSDNRALSAGGNGVLYLNYTDLSSGNTFNTDAVFIFPEGNSEVYEYDFEYTIPGSLVTGSYQFSLGANDGVRNTAETQVFSVEVTN